MRRRLLPRLAVAAIAIALCIAPLFAIAIAAGERTRAGFIALYLPRQPLLVLAATAALSSLLLRRRVFVALHGLVGIVVVLPIMGLSLGAARDSSRPIRLATYNVFFGKLGRTQVLDEIAARDADIVLVQAAWDSMADRLRERLPDRTVHRAGELVLVSRFPVREVDLPADPARDTPAMYVGYLLDTPRGPLRVYNVHAFSPRHALRDERRADTNLAQRETQIAAVVAAAHRAGPPFVIAGDTNLPEHSAIAREHLSGLHDAWTDVGFGFGYTFPAKLPWMRIDRALAGDDVRFVDVAVAPRGASDHRALLVDFEIASR